MEQPPSIALTPIGTVRSPIKDPRPRGWSGVDAEIVVAPELMEALDGLEGFSHIIVLFWMHQVPPEARAQRRRRPGGREDLPLVGVFATRAQGRPNPLGMTVAQLLSRTDNRLLVRGLDAIDGTPVLDLKPYLPPYDALPDARVPDWVWG